MVFLYPIMYEIKEKEMICIKSCCKDIDYLNFICRGCVHEAFV